jgi:hypothetical protein
MMRRAAAEARRPTQAGADSDSIVISDLDHARPARALRLSACVPFLVAIAALGSAPASGAARVAPHPLQTAIVDPGVFGGPDAAAGLDRAAAAGATAIKVPLFWNVAAPTKRPPARPASPSDRAYDWSALDAQLRLIRAHGLEPIVYISGPPDWAMRTIHGSARPDPVAYRAFARAAARRYSGAEPGVPRVRYWQAWNEPNKVVGPAAKPGVEAWYRELVNGFAASVHSVPGDVVVAGGLSPFGISTAVAPLAFMRNLLCVSKAPRPIPSCASKIHFDVWSVDPYTAGGPSHQTARADDISVAGLPTMRSVLDAAVRMGHVVSTKPVRFWVTEFAWDTNPPDPGGVPPTLEARWVSEALHRMWAAGVSLVTWYTLRDQPLHTSAYQSGLYYEGSSFRRDRPKPALTSFRFPFTAYRDAGRIQVWGRTPTSAPGMVRVEQWNGSSWTTVGHLRADRFGIFTGEVRSAGGGSVRASFPAANAISLPFSLVRPPDRPLHPFGATVGASSGAAPSNAAMSQYVEPGTEGSGATVGVALDPVIPATAAAGQPGVPASALGGAARAIGDAGRLRVVGFAALLLTVTLVLALAAVARVRPGRAPAGGGVRPGHR